MTVDIKRCCADVYASDLARLVLGDSLHPGGLKLTGWLGRRFSCSGVGRVG
jgi:arsenite methyltransferase